MWITFRPIFLCAILVSKHQFRGGFNRLYLYFWPYFIWFVRWFFSQLFQCFDLYWNPWHATLFTWSFSKVSVFTCPYQKQSASQTDAFSKVSTLTSLPGLLPSLKAEGPLAKGKALGMRGHLLKRFRKSLSQFHRRFRALLWITGNQNRRISADGAWTSAHERFVEDVGTRSWIPTP